MPWTQFWDMCSGGRIKEPPYEKIYIEAPEETAILVFYNRFKHNPERITCTCCGEDYSITESKSFAQATAYNRGCKWSDSLKKYVESEGCTSVADYKKRPDVLVIPKGSIKLSELQGEVSQQGYVWQD